MNKPSKLLSALVSVLLALFLLTGAIAVPILWRGFYYGQMVSLDLPAQTGFSPEVIREAFDQVMDYLVLGRPFGVGQLQWSLSGMSHFADCKELFHLDFVILTATGAVLLFLLLAAFFFPGFRKKFAFSPIKGAIFSLAVVLLILGIWAFVDFDGLFTTFHRVFFPGKNNWVFDSRYDQIILILPEAFWAHAAGLVAGVILAVGGLLLALEAVIRRILAPKTVYEELRRMA